MLSRLFISNYAIISEIEIEFISGLNIITGETGAGKSILIGALGLILGERADTSVLQDKSKKCQVEGIFHGSDSEEVARFFEENDIDKENEIILRREISSNGKSRAFINDTPVNLTQLQQLASMLVDLHQQFDTLELGRNSFQLDVLDAIAKQTKTRSQYLQAYLSFVDTRNRLKQLEQARDEAMKEYDYFQFLHNELEEAAFSPGELERLEGERGLLEHAEQVNQVLLKVNNALDATEQPVSQLLKTLAQQVEGVLKYHPALSSLAERLRSAQIEIRDIAAEAEQLASGVSMDPARLQLVDERLSLGYRLMKKHNVSDTDGLIAIQEQIGARIGRVLNMDDEIKAAKAAAGKAREEALALAGSLSVARKKVRADVEKKVHQLLERVGMPNARLQVQLTSDTEMHEGGNDRVEFLFDANKSNRFEPLRKVASGGEFSRLLLCIKTLVAGSLAMPLMIFDEIDTGISGEAARQVGILMKEMGTSHQVIAITHQPQIAARADAHYYVFKKEISGAIRTHLKKLDNHERVESIARMMSGEKPTLAAMESARELMGDA